MCGITGAVWTDARWAIAPDVLARMTEVLAHRGPDGRGEFTSQLHIEPPYPAVPGVALGHCRLAVIDPESSRQPMANEDGSVQLVFNGEIYNFRELRQRLEASGHLFRSRGDTEVIVHLYEDEGVDFVRHLVGMFALAIWDRRSRRVVLARDRLGQKPLVYRWQPGRLLFASELKSLLQVPGVSREIDPGAIDEYLLYQYVPHPNTIFRGIHKLAPGHVAVLENDRLTVRPYWQPDFASDDRLTEQDSIETVRRRLREAVRSQLASDVPLGAFLSGGVDSSIIAALAQQHLSRPLKTFTVGFADRDYDESAYARRVAEHLGTEHHELRVEPDYVGILPKLVWHFDEPFADSSAVPTYYLAQQTRAQVTVALSGDGGDELFGGYDRYRAMRLAATTDGLPSALRSALAKALGALSLSGRRKSWWTRARRFAAVLAADPAQRYADMIAVFNERQRAALYTDDFVARLPDHDPADFLGAALSRESKRDPAAAAMMADLVTYLPCDLCTKVDIATMAQGLECRQPMLDHRVVEQAIGIPPGMKLRGGRGKWILRAAFGDLLPREVFRRRKMGFGVPLDHWLRGLLGEFARDTLLSRRALERGYFRRDAIEALLSEHAAARHDHSHRLWALLVLELWHREWATSAP